MERKVSIDYYLIYVDIMPRLHALLLTYLGGICILITNAYLSMSPHYHHHHPITS